MKRDEIIILVALGLAHRGLGPDAISRARKLVREYEEQIREDERKRQRKGNLEL